MILHIQVLRFLAALAVVLHHARPPLIPTSMFSDLPGWLNAVAAMGFSGVDIFFVISGVIMAETTRDLIPGKKTAFKFLSIRFTRIYSGWWPFFFIYLAASFLFRGLPEEKNLLASFFLWPQNLNHQLLPIVWTLCFELYFYAVLGGLLFLKRETMRLALMVCALGVCIFTLFNWATGLYTPTRFGEVTLLHDFYASPLILEFIGGFLLCDLIRAKPQQSWKPFALLGIPLIILATWYQLHGYLAVSGMAGFHHVPERVILIGGAACCLLACALLWSPPTGRLTKIFASLGDASYAMYLSHIAVIYALCLFLTRIGWENKFPSHLLIIFSIIAVMSYSWLHYRWVERPLYNAVRSRLFRSPAPLTFARHA